MSVISIFSASYCHGDEIAARAARELDSDLIDTSALIGMAAQQHSFPREKLERLIHGTTTFFDTVGHSQKRATAYLRSALSQALLRDALVLLGPAGLMLPRRLTHVLRVGLAANVQYRRRQAEEGGLSSREARDQLQQEDTALARWSERFFHLPPWDESLHDILIPMDKTSVEQALAMIMENMGKPALMRTAGTEQAVEDFALAARVNVVLAEAGHDVDVACEDGQLVVTINKYVLRLKRLEKELVSLAGSIEGVVGVETRLGHNFMKDQPKIYPRLDVEMPSRVLLVDDEREFVHTLSERLQTRNLDTAVAYDGEQALAMLQSDPPSVMVLDLKMPGLDGLEVLRRVKKLHPEVEVIILSGHGSDAEQNLALELGAFAYLQKPADIDVLATTMKAANKKVREAGAVKQGDDHPA
jgi:ActR/RegA family two-component response regulator